MACTKVRNHFFTLITPLDRLERRFNRLFCPEIVFDSPVNVTEFTDFLGTNASRPKDFTCNYQVLEMWILITLTNFLSYFYTWILLSDTWERYIHQNLTLGSVSVFLNIRHPSVTRYKPRNTRAICVNLVYKVITLRNDQIALEMHLEGWFF